MDHLRRQGRIIRAEVLKHVSPLSWEHINLTGTYAWGEKPTLVDGFRYAYDGAGRVAHEIQLRDGPAFGNRFTFDAANRPILAQYGVRDVRDAGSPFDLETRYEHFPEARWRRRVRRPWRPAPSCAGRAGRPARG